jgi:hypothetical protein
MAMKRKIWLYVFWLGAAGLGVAVTAPAQAHSQSTSKVGPFGEQFYVTAHTYPMGDQLQPIGVPVGVNSGHEACLDYDGSTPGAAAFVFCDLFYGAQPIGDDTMFASVNPDEPYYYDSRAIQKSVTEPATVRRTVTAETTGYFPATVPVTATDTHTWDFQPLP